MDQEVIACTSSLISRVQRWLKRSGLADALELLRIPVRLILLRLILLPLSGDRRAGLTARVLGTLCDSLDRRALWNSERLWN